MQSSGTHNHLKGAWGQVLNRESGAWPNNGVQATAYGLRFAVLRSGFQPRLTPGVRRQKNEKDLTGQSRESA